MAIRRTDPFQPSIREALQASSVFGSGRGSIQDDFQQASHERENNLRYGPVSSPGSPFAPPAAMPAPMAPAPQPAPAAPLAAAAPVQKPLTPQQTQSANAFDPLTNPVSVALAQALINAQQAGQVAAFETGARDMNLNLDPTNQAPGDFANNMAGAVGLFNRTQGGGGIAPRPGTGPMQAFAPTGLDERALAARGAPVTGYGGAQVTAQQGNQDPFLPPGTGQGEWAPAGRLPEYQKTGNRFTLTQNPNTVPGASGYVPHQVMPAQAMAGQVMPPQVAPSGTPAQTGVAGGTAFERNQAAIKSAQGSGVFTAPDGSMFQRDANGHLQAAGNNPDLAAAAAGKTEAAKTEAAAQVKDAHTLVGEISDAAESSRVQSGAIKRISDLYALGAKSGFGQSVLTSAQSILARATGKDVTVSNQQQLEKELGNLMLESSRSLMKGGGSVSNFERELVGKATANQSLTPQANLQILGVLQRIADRNIALDRERVRLDEMGVPTSQIAKEIRALRDSMPVGVEELQGLGGKATGPQTVGKFKVTVNPPR